MTELREKLPTKVNDVWFCKIGFAGALPPGSDGPMRDAVYVAYQQLTGQSPDFIFSGWGQTLEERELAFVENRLPDPALTRAPVAAPTDALGEAVEALQAARNVLHDALMPDGIYAEQAEPALAKINATLTRLTGKAAT